MSISQVYHGNEAGFAFALSASYSGLHGSYRAQSHYLRMNYHLTIHPMIRQQVAACDICNTLGNVNSCFVTELVAIPFDDFLPSPSLSTTSSAQTTRRLWTGAPLSLNVPSGTSGAGTEACVVVCEGTFVRCGIDRSAWPFIIPAVIGVRERNERRWVFVRERCRVEVGKGYDIDEDEKAWVYMRRYQL
jgi:hypothetical protein